MIVEKIITRTEPIEIEVEGVTLLSVEEAQAAKEWLKPMRGCWWLRSPGHYDYWTAVVNGRGNVGDIGGNVDDTYGVRPALKIRNLESSNLEIGSKFMAKGLPWTVISGNLALCDEIVTEMPFREDWKVEDANVYEASDVKRWLEKWWSE